MDVLGKAGPRGGPTFSTHTQTGAHAHTHAHDQVCAYFPVRGGGEIKQRGSLSPRTAALVTIKAAPVVTGRRARTSSHQGFTKPNYCSTLHLQLMHKIMLLMFTLQLNMPKDDTDLG